MYHPSARRTAGIEIEKDAKDHGVKTEDESDDKTTAKLADSDPTKCIVYSNCTDSSCQLPYRSTSEIHRLRNLWSLLKPCWNYKWVANSNSHWIHWIHCISIDIISSPSLPQAHHIGWMSYGAGALVFFGGTFSWTAKWTSHKPWWNASQRIIVVPLAFKGFVEIFGRWTATMTDTRTRTALRGFFKLQVLLVRVFFVVAICWGWIWLISPGLFIVKFRFEVRMCAKLAWATWCWALPRRWPTTMAWPRRPTLRRWRQGIFFTVDVLSPSVVFLDMGFRWFFRI